MNTSEIMEKNLQYLHLIEELHTLLNDTIKYIGRKMDIDPQLITRLR